MSASAAPGERSETVMMATFDRASRARSRARFVAVVPPSWLTPMTRPAGPASSSSIAASNAWTEIGVPARPGDAGRPIAHSASRRISTTASAACSLVPQPVTMTGRPSSAALRISPARRAAAPLAGARRCRMRAASAGSASIISVRWYGGSARRDGMSVPAHGSGAPASGCSGSRGSGTRRGYPADPPPRAVSEHNATDEERARYRPVAIRIDRRTESGLARDAGRRVREEPRLVGCEDEEPACERDPRAGPRRDPLHGELAAVGLTEQDDRPDAWPATYGWIDEQPVAGRDRRQHGPLDHGNSPRAAQPLEQGAVLSHLRQCSRSRLGS